MEEKEKPLEIPKEIYYSEMEKLMKNPREYICDWAEDNLIHVGRKTFRLICLIPCSHIIPNILFKSKGIRSNINMFVLGSPSSGKSSLVSKFDNFSYQSISQKGISAKKLIQKIDSMDGFFSISIDDFSNILDQPDGYQTVKVLEGALGEEKKASHENMKYDINVDTEGVGLICGTWTDLEKYYNYLKGGLLSRMSLIFLSMTNKQRKEKMEFITDGVGAEDDSMDSKIKEKIIKDYYKLLYDIQAGKSEINQIKGYLIDKGHKKIALKIFNDITDGYSNDVNGDFAREFQDFFRFTVAHAYLNIFNRKVENGILHPIKEDYQFALKLMVETLNNKIALIQSKMFSKELDSPAKLLEVLNSPNVKEDVKNILLNLSPHKKSIVR